MPVEAGLNQLYWDLKGDPAPAFPGMILWGVRTLSASLPPGEYTVRLTADDVVETSTIAIERNPWIEDVTDADLVAQYEFAKEIQAKVAEANSAVIAIRRAKVQMRERAMSSEDGPHEVIHPVMMKLNEVEANIYQVRNRSGQDPLNFPIKVNNRLANLLSMVDRGDGAPNDGMREVFAIMVERLDGYTATLRAIWENDLPAMNAALAERGLDAVDPWDETVVLVAPEG